jgi:hypothetical protein
MCESSKHEREKEPPAHICDSPFLNELVAAAEEILKERFESNLHSGT